MGGDQNSTDTTARHPGIERTVHRFVALVAGIFALIDMAVLIATIIVRMSWTTWFLPPQGISRIDNAISAGKQVGGWFADHVEYVPYFTHAIAALVFAILALRYAAGARIPLMHWLLLEGRR